MSDVQEVLSRLSHSPFRSRIRLQGKELHYLRQKGLLEVLKHAAEFIFYNYFLRDLRITYILCGESLESI